MKLKLMGLFAAGLLSMGCAPGLAGQWDASGHTGVADAFDLDLTFEDETKGLAVFATVDAGEKGVPVCNTKFVDGKVSFVIDTAGGNTCSTLSHPLKFRGALGHDVLVGQIDDADGKRVGVWRAYRKPEK